MCSSACRNLDGPFVMVIVSVKDATGACEDVTLWVSKFSTLLVGCEGGKIFAVSPSFSVKQNNGNNSHQQNSFLIFNDE